jgi:hypothetical protein
MFSNSLQTFFASQYGSLCRFFVAVSEQKHSRMVGVDFADTLQ